MARRGSYAKGVAKREEILERALEVIAREGYRGASVKELADAVGLSQAGLLHYFDSKEELFTEIVRKRDEVDMADYGPLVTPTPPRVDLRDGYVAVIRHNSDVPGLVGALLADVGRRRRCAASGPPASSSSAARTCAGSSPRRSRPRRCGRDHRPHRPDDAGARSSRPSPTACSCSGCWSPTSTWPASSTQLFDAAQPAPDRTDRTPR